VIHRARVARAYRDRQTVWNGAGVVLPMSLISGVRRRSIREMP
jgi:hypothetical protein